MAYTRTINTTSKKTNSKHNDMDSQKIPLEELSIGQLYCSDSSVTYEIPIYQRNYAWEEDQIKILVQDIFDAYESAKQAPTTYYIGTLVTFDKGGRKYEVIDGQQRLTTIYIMLKALGYGDKIKSRLTYRARQKSKDTLLHLGEAVEDANKEAGISNGFAFAQSAIKEIVGERCADFAEYFLDHVHIIHYRVPKDVDLNHYFEVMNSRGEQLEMHEIVKAKLCALLHSMEDMAKFNRIWEACSNMNTYIQQAYKDECVFGEDLSQYPNLDFDNLPAADNRGTGKLRIDGLMNGNDNDKAPTDNNAIEDDKFEPVIDFPNFLLIVLKITRMSEANFDCSDFTLDDKSLVKEFDKVAADEDFVKTFAMNLLKAKYLLDNYIVHHTNDREQDGTNPWQLEIYCHDKGKGDAKNLADDNVQKELVQLLSMFEVTFSAHQRKNYLFYCLMFLFGDRDVLSYRDFLRALADKYFHDVYLNPACLNSTNNRPIPNSFDQVMLRGGRMCMETERTAAAADFISIYGDGSEACKGIQLYVFNYTDYKLWKKYADEMRGSRLKDDQSDRQQFFSELGCTDFGLDAFNKFYFSRTRKSLEHFYPQAKVGEGMRLSAAQINCFGNFAMIGADANSRGSDWYPKAKIDFYKDSKFDQVSVASLKLKIMMQMCKDNLGKREEGDEWNFADIRAHQEKMLALLFG